MRISRVLPWPALAEQHQVVAGQQGGLELGQHGVVEADDAGEGRLARAEPGEQVLPQLVLGAARGPAGGAELGEGRRLGVPGAGRWGWGGLGGVSDRHAANSTTAPKRAPGAEAARFPGRRRVAPAAAGGSPHGRLALETTAAPAARTTRTRRAAPPAHHGGAARTHASARTWWDRPGRRPPSSSRPTTATSWRSPLDDRLRRAVAEARATRRPGRTQGRPRGPDDERTPWRRHDAPRHPDADPRRRQRSRTSPSSPGLPYDRVERFAAPVLAEREHLALMALAASVRRRGETSGHRTLRATVAERLLKRGVDADDVAWDAHRLEDGRWAVTADYRLDDAEHHATFTFDQRGRFSVAGDDEARWLIGEQPPAAPGTAAPQRRRRRAHRRPQRRAGPGPGHPGGRRRRRPGGRAATADEDERDDDVLPARHRGRADRGGRRADRDQPTALAVPSTRTTSPATESVREPAEGCREPDAGRRRGAGSRPSAGRRAARGAAAVPASRTPRADALYAMLGSDGYSEDSPRVYAGLSDASAVPETAGGGWEPAIVVDYPVEPSLADEAELPPTEHPDRSQVPMDDKASVELSTPGRPGPAAARRSCPAPTSRRRRTRAPTRPTEPRRPRSSSWSPSRRRRRSPSASAPPCPAGTRSCSAGPSPAAEPESAVRPPRVVGGQIPGSVRAGGHRPVRVADPVAPRARVDPAVQAGAAQGQQGVRGRDPRAAVQHRLLEAGEARGDLGRRPELAVGGRGCRARAG